MFDFAETSPAPTIAEPTAITFTPPPKPGRLQLAERNLAATRKKRAEVDAKLTDAIRRRHDASHGHSAIETEIGAMASELALVDDQIRIGRAELAECRAGFLPDFRAAAGPTIDAAAERIFAGLALVDEGLDALRQVRAWGAQNGLSNCRLADAEPTLRRVVAEARRAVK